MTKSTEELITHLGDPRLIAVLKIQSLVLTEIQQFFRQEGFLEIPPVMISPITDPLSHSVHNAVIEYEGQQLQITKSMIFHKQVAISLSTIDKLFIISPNIRLEKREQAKSRHLIEFQQIDFEIKLGTKEQIYALMEKLLTHLIKQVKLLCANELKFLGRTLPDIIAPFTRYKTYEVEKQFGGDYEKILSESAEQPFWLESFYREFYDKEDPIQPGHFINYDLIYPEGFEEGLSGGEREYNYEIIKRKMAERQTDPKDYEIYLELAKAGLIQPTAGAGFGLQRLLRYLTGIREMEKVVLFPRGPREKIIF